MVKPEHQRELLGVGLLALALFILLALLPVQLLGEVGGRWFPSGNVVGIVGRVFQQGVVGILGVGAAALPFLAVLAGFHLGGWVAAPRLARLGLLVGGLAVLVPTFFHLLPAGPPWSGWLGRGLGSALASALGGFGAGLLLAVLFVLLSLATLGWNPLRSPARWTLAGTSQGWRMLGARLARWQEERAAPAGVRADGSTSPEDTFDEPGAGDEDHGAGRVPDPAGNRSEGSPPAAVDSKEAGGSPGRGRGGRSGGQLDLLPDPRDPRELAGDAPR